MSLPFYSSASEFLEGPQGLSIHYRRRGLPDRPALLLTPGAGQSLLCWRRQMEPLSEQFQVIAWDTPGHGGTRLGASMQQSASLYADAMEAVVDGLHLRETGYIVVAWSMAGWIAHNFLLKYGTQGLRGAVLVGTLLDTNELLQAAAEAAASQANEASSNISSQNVADRDRALLTFVRLFTDQTLPEEEYYLTLGYVAWYMMNGGTMSSDLMADRLPGDAMALLREQRIPVLFIQGESDRIVSTRVVRAIAVESGAELYICQSGHSPFLEQPDLFNEQVLVFARRAFALSQTSAS